MPHINLLPWREEALRHKQQQYFSLLTFLGLMSFLVVFLISQFYQNKIENQRSRNQFILNEIKILDSRIKQIKALEEKKTDLVQRMNLIEQLQTSRNVVTRILDEITRIVPSGVHFIKLEKKDNELFILGKSESNNHLANMIREIQSSELLEDAELESITNSDTNSKLLSDFKIKIKIKGLHNSESSGRRS